MGKPPRTTLAACDEGVETDIRQGLAIAAAMPPPRVTYGRPHAA